MAQKLSDEDRKLVTNVRMQDIFTLDGGQSVKTRTVTYSVGTQGPFQWEIPWAQFTPEKLSDEWARRVTELRALGLLS